MNTKSEVSNFSGLMAQREGEQLLNWCPYAHANRATHTGVAPAAPFVLVQMLGNPPGTRGPICACVNGPRTPAWC